MGKRSTLGKCSDCGAEASAPCTALAWPHGPIKTVHKGRPRIARVRGAERTTRLIQALTERGQSLPDSTPER